VAEPQFVARPGYRGLLELAAIVGAPFELFQKRVARAHFGPEREVVWVVPRGNYKTTTAALVGLHHLMTTQRAEVTVGAASETQARILYNRLRGFALHPLIKDQVAVRHREARFLEDDGQHRTLKVIASDGARAHGLSSSLFLADEIWAWQGDDLLEAMLTALVKNPQARFLGISTPAARADSPLSHLRARALAGTVAREGAVLDATAPGLRWLEWSTPDDWSLDDMRLVKKCNPAAYITAAGLREQQQRVTPSAFAQFHAGRWGAGNGAWLPHGAWAACAGDLADEDEPVLLGVDIGGSRSATAVVGVTKELHVAEVHCFQGDDAVLDAVATVLEIASRRPVLEVAHDPWRFRSEALRLERDHGLPVVEIPMSSSRLVALSETLHAAVVSGRLTHPDDELLNQHVADAVAKPTQRGWRLDKVADKAQIDLVIALAMALDRAEIFEPPVDLAKHIH
jgi:phage terminase large subunit-like protein